MATSLTILAWLRRLGLWAASAEDVSMPGVTLRPGFQEWPQGPSFPGAGRANTIASSDPQKRQRFSIFLAKPERRTWKSTPLSLYQGKWPQRAEDVLSPTLWRQFWNIQSLTTSLKENFDITFQPGIFCWKREGIVDIEVPELESEAAPGDSWLSASLPLSAHSTAPNRG